MTAEPRKHKNVELTVVQYLGRAALLGLLGVIYLVHQSVSSANEIDPSTVALVAGVSTLAGSALGALGGILASAGKSSPQEVVTPPDTPLDVTAVEGDAAP